MCIVSFTLGSGIPAACLTIEEAEMLLRMHQRGQNMTIHLRFTSHDDGTVTSRNTIFDVTGKVKIVTQNQQFL